MTRTPRFKRHLAGVRVKDGDDRVICYSMGLTGKAWRGSAMALNERNPIESKEMRCRVELLERLVNSEFGQQGDTLLLVGIGASNHGDAAFGFAPIVGQMRHAGGNVEKITGARGQMMFELLTIPHSGFAAEYIDGGFVIGVLVRL